MSLPVWQNTSDMLLLFMYTAYPPVCKHSLLLLRIRKKYQENTLFKKSIPKRKQAFFFTGQTVTATEVTDLVCYPFLLLSKKKKVEQSTALYLLLKKVLKCFQQQGDIYSLSTAPLSKHEDNYDDCKTSLFSKHLL